jgi:hypothetical protein
MVWPRLGMPLGSAVMALHLINMIVSDIDKMTAEAK